MNKPQGLEVFENMLAGRSVAGDHFSNVDYQAMKQDPRYAKLSKYQKDLLGELADPPKISIKYPRLPKEFYPRGSFKSTPLNREFFINLRTTDEEHFNIFINKYGCEQINDRMQEQLF